MNSTEKADLINYCIDKGIPPEKLDEILKTMKVIGKGIYDLISEYGKVIDKHLEG